VGYNPLRRYRGSKVVDLTIMLSTFALVVALVVWATRS
jgi:hypothetical protein